jgi:hypothetical protein
MSALEIVAFLVGPDAYKRLLFVVAIACIIFLIYIYLTSKPDDFI